MPSRITALDNFISQEVEKGSCASRDEAVKSLSSRLSEEELDLKIAKGRADIIAGRTIEITDDSSADFIDKLAGDILPKST